MANHDPTTSSRRSLLGASAAMLLLAAPATGEAKREDQDAEMIAACKAYIELDGQLLDTGSAVCDLPMNDPRAVAADQAMRIMGPQLWGLETAITEMPATTPEGLRWKARAALHSMEGDARRSDHGAMHEDDDLAWSVLFAVAGRAVA